MKEVLSDGYAEMIVTPLNPRKPHPFYILHNLYLGWMRDPEAIKHYGQHGQPTFVLLSHDDCGMAKKLASDPAGWGSQPLDQLARQNLDFRRSIETRYHAGMASGELPSNRPFHDYLAVQLARRSALHAISALEKLKQPGDTPPLVVPLHYGMDEKFHLIDPKCPFRLDTVINFNAQRSNGSSCMQWQPTAPG